MCQSEQVEQVELIYSANVFVISDAHYINSEVLSNQHNLLLEKLNRKL